jgi:hypothetical protein
MLIPLELMRLCSGGEAIVQGLCIRYEFDGTTCVQRRERQLYEMQARAGNASVLRSGCRGCMLLQIVLSEFASRKETLTLRCFQLQGA